MATHATSATSSVFTWLDQVRERRSMFARSLSDLESLVWGYCFALGNHRIVESVPSMGRHFLVWLRFRTRWSTCSGWAQAIASHVADREEQFAEFFRLVDEYRQLVPIVLCTARLKSHHQPTGKRVVIGLDGRMERPTRVDVLRYVPEPLHFLRFHYPEKTSDGDLLMARDGSHRTTLLDAKRWARDELQVKRHEWEKME